MEMCQEELKDRDLTMKNMDKRILIAKERSLTYDGKSFLVDDLFDKAFYEYSNRIAKSFYNDTYGVNEIYSNVVLYYLAIDKFIKENITNIEKIDISKASDDICFFLTDIASKNELTIVGRKRLRAFAVKIEYAAFHFCSFVYLGYLMMKIPYTKEQIESHEKISVLRYKANFTKTRNFTDIHKEYENPYEKNTIYRLFSKNQRLGWVWKAYVNSFPSLRKQKEFYRGLLGNLSPLALNIFYKKRIVHAELYKILLENYFPYYQEKSYYTVFNLDRFSCIEDQVASLNHIKTYNLPHGIEYGYRFPKGFSSQVFYALTESSAIALNKLYDTNKYIYDEEVATKLLKIENVKPHCSHIVFFTEPREVYVNIDIINGLTPKLKEKGWRLCLKLHPGDKKTDYENLDVDILTDYNEALCGNICISRKSTILLEAIYNDSVPISIITNVKDQTIYDNFPSLQSDKIIKTHTVNELMTEIEKNYPL